MRFFEFKLPAPESDFGKELSSYLTKLIQTAKSLPENDPKRIEFNQFLQDLKSQAGISEDAIEDLDQATVNAILSVLAKKGVKEATMYLMNGAEILGDNSVQAALKAKEVAISKREQEKAQEISKGKLDKAKAVAAKVGKSEDFARELLPRLERYENDQLINDFMDLVLQGKALSSNIIVSQPVSKINLKKVINPKIAEILDNRKAFEGLVLLPFSEQKAGFGGGVGPGEALLAMLIPKAKKAPGPSDLQIGEKDIWEIKGGGSDTAKAWLDSATVAPAQLRDIFNKETASLKPQFRKKISYSDGSQFTLSQVLDLADFRHEKFRYLRTAFRYLDSNNHKNIIKGMYQLLFPGVKKKEPKLYSSYVEGTIKAILEGNRRLVADIQAKLAFLEYSLGSYQADNFIIYNYLSNDLIIFRGMEGILDSIENKDNMVKTETITMGNAKKSSPGVTLLSKPGVRKASGYD
jgi:hypothetical protein